MGYFSATIAAKLAGRHVEAGLLAFMDFAGTPRRWWTGFGTLTAGGNDWQGLGGLIEISGLEQPIGGTAPQTTFRLAGVDPAIVALAAAASASVKGRAVQVFVQFFDATPADGSVAAWTPLDDPAALWSGVMDQMRFAASGPGDRVITLTAESLWAGRNRPAFGLFTDRDQNARYPGDRGLEQVATLVDKTIRWPVL